MINDTAGVRHWDGDRGQYIVYAEDYDKLAERLAATEAVLVDLLEDAALEHENRKYGVYQIGHDSMLAARRLFQEIKKRTSQPTGDSR